VWPPIVCSGNFPRAERCRSYRHIRKKEGARQRRPIYPGNAITLRSARVTLLRSSSVPNAIDVDPKLLGAHASALDPFNTYAPL